MKFLILASLASLAVTAVPTEARAHCQVPCGIYDDHARLKRLGEDAFTIEKAMKQISALSKKHDPQSRNQLVRWVMVKGQHAERVMRTISDYFLAQKVKRPRGSDLQSYYKKLGAYHAVLVAAMRCKQSTSLKEVASLRKALTGIGARSLRRH